MIVYFATWLEDNQGITLTRTDADNRLLSYFFLKDLLDHQEFYTRYIGTGVIPALKKRSKL